MALLIFNPPQPAKATPLVVPDYSPSIYHYANRITQFFERRGCPKSVPCGNKEWILRFTAQQVFWLQRFKIEHTAEKFLSNTTAESWYNPLAVSSAGCIGATQVCSIELADKLIRNKGYDPAKLGDSQLDAARGVAIYWHKLKYRTNGDPWDAVQKYNGAGKAAVSHRNKVWRYHQEIFG